MKITDVVATDFSELQGLVGDGMRPCLQTNGRKEEIEAVARELLERNLKTALVGPAVCWRCAADLARMAAAEVVVGPIVPQVILASKQ